MEDDIYHELTYKFLLGIVKLPILRSLLNPIDLFNKLGLNLFSIYRYPCFPIYSYAGIRLGETYFLPFENALL